MLGVVENPNDDPADQLLKQLGEELGVGDTYRKTPVGMFFGEQPARPCPTPTSAARGRIAPAACVRALHGRLPARGQEHAGQELPVAGRAARRHGDARPQVIDVRPLGAEDGSDGYAVDERRLGACAATATET